MNLHGAASMFAQRVLFGRSKDCEKTPHHARAVVSHNYRFGLDGYLVLHCRGARNFALKLVAGSVSPEKEIVIH